MKILSIFFLLSSPAGHSAAPWLRRQRNHPQDRSERVRAVFPDAEHIDAAPMSLKEIFIAIAQSPSTNR